MLTLTYPFVFGLGRVTTPRVDRNLPMLDTCGHFDPFPRTHCLISPGFFLKAGLEILGISLRTDLAARLRFAFGLVEMVVSAGCHSHWSAGTVIGNDRAAGVGAYECHLNCVATMLLPLSCTHNGFPLEFWSHHCCQGTDPRSLPDFASKH